MKEMVGGCCVCSDERGWQENPLVYCDGQDCSVAVHQACYGIVSVPTGPWYCEKCMSGENSSRFRCDLCPMREGALKRTDKNGWAHVVCALYIPEVLFGNVTTMDPIILSQVPPDRFSKVCYICEEKGLNDRAKIGACMTCNKNGCKTCFHVTCAQQEGLLCEESGRMDNIKYCGYCSHHLKKLRKGDPSFKAIPPYRPVTSASAASIAGDGTTNKVATKNSTIVGGNCSSVHTNSNNNHHSSSNQRENCVKTPSNSKFSPLSTPSSTPSTSAVQLTHATTASVSSTTPPSIGQMKSPSAAAPLISQQAVLSSNLQTVSFSMPPAFSQPLASVSRPLVPVDGGGLETASSTWTKPVPQIQYLGFNNDILHSNTSGHISGTTTVANPLAVSTMVAASAVGAGSNILAPVAAISSVLPPSGFATKNVLPVLGGPNGSISTSQPKIPNASGPVSSASSEESSSSSATAALALASGTKSGKAPSGPSGNHKRKSESKEQAGGGGTGNGETTTDKPKKPRRNSTKTKTVASLLELVSPVVEDTQKQHQIQQQHQQSSIDSVIAATAAGYQSSQFPSAVVPERAGLPSAPAATMAQDTVEQSSIPTPLGNIIGPPPPSKSTAFRSPQEGSSLAGTGSFPTSLEQLLERQWEQGSQFLMEQAQHFDIASLLSCLHQLKVENQRLEDHVVNLAGRRDHLLAVNARLSLALGQQHQSPNSPRINASVPAVTPFLHLQAPTSQDTSHDTSENSASSRLSAPPNTSTPIALHPPFIGATIVPVVTTGKSAQPAATAGSSSIVVSPTNRSALGSLTAAVAAPNFSMVPGSSGGAGSVFSSVKSKPSQEPSPDRQQQATAGSFLMPRAPTPMLATEFVRPQTPLVSSQYPLAQDPRFYQQLLQHNALAAVYGSAYNNLIQSTSPHRAAAAVALAQTHLASHAGVPPSTQEKS